MQTAASTRLKQRNHQRAEEREYKARLNHRREFMTHITVICSEEVLTVCREFSGNDANQELFKRVAVGVVHSYCNMLIEKGIQLSPGQYEPHALFFRTHAVKFLMYLMTGNAETDPVTFMQSIASSIVEMSLAADEVRAMSNRKSTGFLANVAMVGSLSRVKP